MSQTTNVRAHQTTAVFIQSLAKNELPPLFHYLSKTLCANVESCISDDESEWIKPHTEGGPAQTTQ